jgi:mRNA-degrading endonuclease RelE of RelBE toxin-antitoxin system
MYQLKFAKHFNKDFKKLPPEAQKIISEKILPQIKENPKIGEIFSNKKLAGIHKIGFRANKNSYRLAYNLKEQELLIFLIATGPRENFYQKLFQRLLP